jgi:hypothetical protein
VAAVLVAILEVPVVVDFVLPVLIGLGVHGTVVIVTHEVDECRSRGSTP